MAPSNMDTQGGCDCHGCWIQYVALGAALATLALSCALALTTFGAHEIALVLVACTLLASMLYLMADQARDLAGYLRARRCPAPEEAAR